MARYTGADCRQCRREGAKLFLKGDRCFSAKCAILRRADATGPKKPGQHGAGKKKVTEYGTQLREKQKAKRIYGLGEKQFHMYYERAERMRGVTGTNMLVLIERRLDNVVYRMGLGVSRSQARQLVSHRHITVNGSTVNIPSYIVNVGDEIAVKESKRDSAYFTALKETKKAGNMPKWLDFNPEFLNGKVLAMPTREDIDLSIEERMIIELYSK